MQIRAEQLEAQLAKALAPVYLVHGDEPLLALEAADAARAAARKRGFTEREVFEPNRYFDWSEFQHALASLSLFGGKKIVELRLSTGKPGAQGAAAIAGYCERPSPDILLLASLPRLARRRDLPVRALSRAGALAMYPVERQRCRRDRERLSAASASAAARAPISGRRVK